MKRVQLTIWPVLLTLGFWLGGAGAATPPPAQVLVEDTTAKVLEAIRGERDTFATDPEQLRRLIDDLVFPHFDFDRMGARVLGKGWRDATGEQREAFIREFRRLLIRTYSLALVEYSDDQIEFLPARLGERDSEITVRMQVSPAVGSAIPIDYQMHLNHDAWQVYDVSIDGVSLVVSYRASFARRIRESGIDALIEDLTHHNDDRQ